MGLVWCCCWGVRGSGLRACGCYLARGVGACGAAGEGHQRDVAGALDGDAEPTLVARADSGHAARENLAALLHELREDVGALVVDEVHFLDTELADLLFAEILALAARASARSAGAAFAARTAVTAAGAVSATVTAGAFATRGAAGGLRLLLLLICHNCLPFPFASGRTEAGRNFLRKALAEVRGCYSCLCCDLCVLHRLGAYISKGAARPPHSKLSWLRLALGLLELLVPVLARCGAGDGRRELRASGRTFSGA